jgi:hypothetical protein
MTKASIHFGSSFTDDQVIVIITKMTVQIDYLLTYIIELDEQLTLLSIFFFTKEPFLKSRLWPGNLALVKIQINFVAFVVHNFFCNFFGNLVFGLKILHS